MIDRRDFLKALALAGVVVATIPGAALAQGEPEGEDNDYITFQVRRKGLRAAQIRNVPPVSVWATDGVMFGKATEPAVVVVQFVIDPSEYESVLSQLQGTKPDGDLRAA